MNWSPVTPLLQFAPSADPTEAGVILEATNLIPSDRGWRAAYGLNNALSGQLPGTPVGAALFQLPNGEYVTVAGTGTALYKQTGATILENIEVLGRQGAVAFAGVTGTVTLGGPQAITGTAGTVALSGVQATVTLGSEMVVLGRPGTLAVAGVAGTVGYNTNAITGTAGVVTLAGVQAVVVQAYGGWTKISTDTYHASPDYRWRFAQMGDYLLASNASDTVQVSFAGQTFTAITGAPKANLIESVFGFIMAAGTTEATYGNQPDRWWCSGIFDHTDWTPALETQCTTGRLVDTPGPIRALRRLGSAMVAYKDASMYVGDYVQPPTVWQWRLVSSDVGTASHDAVVNIGRAHLFMGNRNFFSWDGAQLSPIGEPVREWFFGGELSRPYDDRVQATHDPANALVYWFYPPATDGGALTRGVVYNYRVGRWGVCTYNVAIGLEYVSPNITYDTLGNFYSTWEEGVDLTYDSAAWLEQNVTPAVFSTDRRVYTLDGPSGSASFTTGHLGDDQQFSLVRRVRVRWLVAPDSALLKLYTQDEHGSEFIYRTQATLAGNRFDLLASARWHQAEISTAGEMEFAGMAVDIERQGAW